MPAGLTTLFDVPIDSVKVSFCFFLSSLYNAAMFAKHSKNGYKEPVRGIKQKTLVYGSRTLMTEFLLAKDSILPEHSHPYEQTGCLVKGHILLKIGDTQHDTRPGDSWCIPADVPHGAKIFEDSIAIEIFSPVREDYIPKDL